MNPLQNIGLDSLLLYPMTYLFIQIFFCFWKHTERPVINIITATGGCGYVIVSWAVINNVPNDAMCGIAHLIVTLSSVDVSITEIVTVNYYNFTRLPDDTLFNVTVIGTSINEKDVISRTFTSVKTMESMYVFI